MKTSSAQIYRCPYTADMLTLQAESQDSGEVMEGRLVSASGRIYPIRAGVAHLLDSKDEPDHEAEKQQVQYYESVGERYETGIEWLFKSFQTDEQATRDAMVELLHLKPGMRVLETGSGTCRSSVRIAQKLGKGGQLFLQDLAVNMLTLGKKRYYEQLQPEHVPQTEFFVGNACTLPFPDGYFDASFHFGALNLFADPKAAVSEMTRVVRKGGRVVFGDESTAPWLRETTYGKILSNSNPLYDYPLPLDILPENAVNPCLRWVIGNAFYLFDYTVGEGTPPLDIDLPIPGPRGGTHRTRFYGKLEGVTPEIKQLAEKAARESGMSTQQWLEKAIKAQAEKK